MTFFEISKHENWTDELIYVHRTRFICGFISGALWVFVCFMMKPVVHSVPLPITEPIVYSVPLITTRPVNKIEMEVTAYCGCEKCCGSHADGITASGYKLQNGSKIIAAPKSIPFGTKIYVPGYGLASVEDRGGAIKGSRLDLYFHTHKEALQWGRQQLIVEMRE